MTTTLFSTVEVAERLGLSAAAVAQAVRSGQLEPAARTADDLLFNERSIAEYQRGLEQAAAAPPPTPPEGSRAEWASELGRLNSWLGELHASLAPPPLEPAPPSPEARAAAAAAAPPTPAQIPPSMEVAAPVPVATSPAATPVVANAQAAPAPASAEPPAPATEPAPASPQAQSRAISRQAMLVVQPIQRFRTSVEIAAALSRLPGLADVRLEGIDGGVASYRLTLSDAPPSGEDISAALASFGLHLHLVEAGR